MINRLVLLIVLVPLALAAGCAGGEKRAGDAVPYTADPSSDGVPWADYVDADAMERFSFVAAPGPSPGHILLVRAEEGRLVGPSESDGIAVSSALTGWIIQAFTRATAEATPSVDRSAIRRVASRDCAGYVLVAQFAGKGRDRRLTATLYDTRTGRELSRYGPGEPSLTIATHHLTQKPHPN